MIDPKTSLKRGHFLMKAADKAARAIEIEPTLNLSIYQDMSDDKIADLAKAHEQKIADQHAQSIALITAAFEIRKLKDHAGQKHGIADLLNRLERTKAIEGHLRGLISAITSATGTETSVDAIRLRAEKRRDATPSERYYGSDGGNTVALAVLSEARIVKLRTDLARLVEQKARINDLLTVRNVSCFITLSEETIATLKAAQIIVDESGDDDLTDQASA